MFITFEGIEGSGKSTQITKLAEHLRTQGKGVATTFEPGGHALGKALRAMLLDPANKDLSPRAELFLYLADRAQHLAQVVRPALNEDIVVLCDRFADSTTAYQGYGRGVDLGELRAVNAMAVDGLWPDLTLLLDLPPDVGLKRAFSRNIADGTAATEGRFEAESLAFHTRVREGYLALAALNKDRFRIVDASRPPDEVFGDVRLIVDKYLAG
ncbi:MAG: dTMP kinase [Desulfovibrio sp.]|nr:MAG: dTMP kinase [Desulfovibrio sp.]